MNRPGISQTKRLVYNVAANKNAIVKVLFKLPAEVETVTGVFFSIAHTMKLQGTVALRFSEGISNSLLHQFVRTMQLRHRKIKYIPLWENVSEASTIQGIYIDQSGININYTMKIYIEYIPRKK